MSNPVDPQLHKLTAEVMQAIEQGFHALQVPCVVHVTERMVSLRVAGCSVGLRSLGRLHKPEFQTFSAKAGLDGRSAVA